MFAKARLTLTAWYVLVILLISGTLSVLFYIRTVRVLQQEFVRIQNRIEKEQKQYLPRNPQNGPRLAQTRLVLEQNLETAKRQITIQLLVINGVIVVICAGAAYFLAGRTLAPIQYTLEQHKRFISDAAHELRTPLTALRTSIEVNMMDNKMNTQTRIILQENLEYVQNLESLTKSLLRLSRYHDKDQPLFTQQVDIDTVVQRVTKHLNPLVKKKKQTLQVHTEQNGLCIQSQEEIFFELLVIFLDNAIKYTPEKGTLTLTIRKGKKYALCIIQDTGVGIARHHLPHIFDRFYRVDTARTRVEDTEGGYGLGLSVAQKILEQHRGRVKVESERGSGTTFTLSLPLCEQGKEK